MFTILSYLLAMLRKVPITLVVLVLTALYIIYRFYRRFKKKQQERSELWTMEERKHHAQWVVVLGRSKEFDDQYVKLLVEGRLKILHVPLPEKSEPALSRCDHVIPLSDMEALTSFFSCRHLKLFLNLASLSLTNSTQDQEARTAVMKLCDLAFKNMKEHSMGTIITVYTNKAESEVFGKACTSWSKEMMKELPEPKPRIYSQCVVLPETGGDIGNFASRSFEGLGVTEIIA